MSFPATDLQPQATSDPPPPTTMPTVHNHHSNSQTAIHVPPHAPTDATHAPYSSTKLPSQTLTFPATNQSPIADLAQILTLQVQNQQRLAEEHQKMVEDQAKKQSDQAKQQQTLLQLLNNLLHTSTTSHPQLLQPVQTSPAEGNVPSASSLKNRASETIAINSAPLGISEASDQHPINTTDSATKKRRSVHFGEVLVQEFTENAHSDTINAHLLKVLQQQRKEVSPNPPSHTISSQATAQKSPLLDDNIVHKNQFSQLNNEVSSSHAQATVAAQGEGEV